MTADNPATRDPGSQGEVASATLEEALACIQRGWAVFPLFGVRDGYCACGNPECPHPGKHPMTMHGLKDATTDADVVTKWFSCSGSNLGIATGACSGVFALDEDPRHGGDETLAELEREHGPLPPTVEVLTGGGGTHKYFRHPGHEVRSQANALGPGLDLKGDGGYVAGPTSMHVSGRRYEWELGSHPDEVAVAEAPEWLLGLVARPLEPAPGADKKDKVIPRGRRNSTLASLAGSMRRRGMSPEAILAALLEENKRCEPALSADEVSQIARSISRYEPPKGPPYAGRLPVIMLNNKHLREQTSEALKAAYTANDPPRVFRRGTSLARTNLDENGMPFIERLSEAAFRGYLARSADYIRLDAKGAPKPVAPPPEIVEDCLSLGRWEFPPLHGIIEAPVLRPDGTAVTEPGYDPATGLYYQPSPGLLVPRIPLEPTAEDIEAAVGLISEVVCDFPFDTSASSANALAAMITPIVRPLIDGPMPMATIDKPQPGTGAGLLAEVVNLVATGRSAAMMTAQKDDEGWRKEITSILLRGAMVTVVDNVEGKLHAPSLASVLTATTWQDRVLGGNEMAVLPARTFWLATGNNIILGGDLPRRCYWVRMDAKMARPWQRKPEEFRHSNLLAWLAENRGRILAAILTVASGWVVAGRQKDPGLRILGSYVSYCHVVGGVLAFMGVKGFLENLDSLYDEMDTETPQWSAFLEVWHRTCGDAPVTTAQLVEKINNSRGLREVLPDKIADTAARTYQTILGQNLAKKNKVRYPNGLLLEKAGKSHRAVVWKVVRFEGQTSPDSVRRGEVGEVETTPAHTEEATDSVCGAGDEEASLNLTLSTKEDEVESPAEVDPYHIAEAEAVIGMSIEAAEGTWRSHGCPILHLGPGENSSALPGGLSKLLRHPLTKAEHIQAVAQWLKRANNGQTKAEHDFEEELLF